MPEAVRRQPRPNRQRVRIGLERAYLLPDAARV
jgi:hypothetical protein